MIVGEIVKKIARILFNPFLVVIRIIFLDKDNSRNLGKERFRKAYKSGFAGGIKNLIPFQDVVEVIIPKLLFFMGLFLLSSIAFNDSRVGDAVIKWLDEIEKEEKVDKGVVVVLIDDYTLRGVGLKDSRRDLIFNLTEKITEYSPKVIGLDYVFLNGVSGEDGYTLNTRCDVELQNTHIVVGSIKGKYNEEFTEIPPSEQVFKDDSYKKCIGWGHLYVNESIDFARVRTVPITDYDVISGRLTPSLALQMWAMGGLKELGVDSDAESFRDILTVCSEKRFEAVGNEVACKLIGNKLVGDKRLSYRHGNKAFDVLSASEILNPINHEWLFKKLNNSYVVIGDAYVKSPDYVSTPLGTLLPFELGDYKDVKMPGVFVHAYALKDILSEEAGEGGFIDDDSSMVMELGMCLISFVIALAIFIKWFIYSGSLEEQRNNFMKYVVWLIVSCSIVCSGIIAASVYYLSVHNVLVNAGVVVGVSVTMFFVSGVLILVGKDVGATKS